MAQRNPPSVKSCLTATQIKSSLPQIISSQLTHLRLERALLWGGARGQAEWRCEDLSWERGGGGGSCGAGKVIVRGNRAGEGCEWNLSRIGLTRGSPVSKS
jgi:hypothetical protein